jgi:hypothetical protein
LQKALELNPNVFPGHVSLSHAYILLGRAQDALPEIGLLGDRGMCASLYAIAYHALGREKESDAALRELITKYHASHADQITEVYAFRNQSDEAPAWLDRAYAQRDGGLIETKVDLVRHTPRRTATELFLRICPTAGGH